ncbi:MAG: hypothetical protein IKB25_14015 [Lentisphaeria bacterium]|nr:hypothetical protein [Lentisphaeria bacterium]
MKLLKKHYEKFIFISLLFLFLVLFGLQLGIGNDDEGDGFVLPPARVNHQKLELNSEAYNIEATLKKLCRKLSVATPKADAKDKTDKKDSAESADKTAQLGIDLITPPVLAKCPKGEHLIPVTDFPANKSELEKKKCSFCSSPLEYIPPEQIAVVDPEISTKDSDNDGIPDADEVKLGLDPNNANDAARDTDEDGFSNLEEYRSKTDIKDPKSRDSYAKKLFVKEIKESKIGIRVVRIQNDKNEKDVSKWGVQFDSVTKIKRGKTERVTRRTMKVPRIGRELKKAGLSGEDYILEKIIPKFDDNQGNRENVSTVILKRKSDGLLFEAKNGEDFIDPRKEVIYELEVPDSIDKRKEITVTTGQEFQIGNENTGIDKFVTLSAVKRPDEKEAENRMTAKVKNVERGSVEDVKTRRTDITGGMEPMPDEPQQTIKRF